MTTQSHKTETGLPLDRTLRSFVGYNIKRSYLMIREKVLDILEPHGLKPTSFSALVIIADNPNLSQSQLADALQIKRSGVVLIVDDLEQRELIARNKVPGDRRSYALKATLKGMRLKDRLTNEVYEGELGVFANLSTREIEVLRELFSKVEGSPSSTERNTGSQSL